MAHISALRFLHRYINSIKTFSLQSVLSQNQPLERELTLMTMSLSGDPLFQVFPC